MLCVKRDKAQIPLRQLCDKVRELSRTLLQTQIMKVSVTEIMLPTFMICVADFRDLCPR